MCGKGTKYFCQIADEVFCYRPLKSEQRSEIKTSHLLSMYVWLLARTGEQVQEWASHRLHPVASESNSVCPSTITAQRSIARNVLSSVVIFIMTSVRRLVCVTYSRVVLEALSTHLGFFCRIVTTSNIIICTTEAGGVLRISVNSPDLREYRPRMDGRKYRQQLALRLKRPQSLGCDPGAVVASLLQYASLRGPHAIFSIRPYRRFPVQ